MRRAWCDSLLHEREPQENDAADDDEYQHGRDPERPTDLAGVVAAESPEGDEERRSADASQEEADGHDAQQYVGEFGVHAATVSGWRFPGLAECRYREQEREKGRMYDHESLPLVNYLKRWPHRRKRALRWAVPEITRTRATSE